MDKIDLIRMVVNPTGFMLETLLKQSMSTFSNSATNKEITPEELSEEAVKANLQSTVLAEQAKVEQEISIAKRILIAEKVEIEEFYDTSGAGHLGVKTDGTTFSLGAQGEGKRVTKRVIKFKGFNSEAISLLNAASEKNNSESKDNSPSSDICS
ncbi:TPA: hypothetical protein OUD64_003852 [Enterobacter kobei]|nr:hypothetical protein [Enterobacter kobei]